MDADPFDAFGIDPTFDIDEDALRRAWLARSLAAHPDRAAGDDAHADTARLNDARRVLQNPELRADALLRRLGGPAKDQEKGLPDGFLMNVMLWREELDAARSGGNAEEVEACRARAVADRAACIERVRSAFASLADPPEPSALAALRVELNAWRYLERLMDELDRPEVA